MKAWQLIVFVIQLTTLISSNSTFAESNPVLRLTIPENFAPFYYQNKDGDFEGVSYEIAQAVFTKLGYELEITQLHSMRLMLSELKSGRQDVAINLTSSFSF